MASFTVIPNGTYQPGTRSFTPVTLPANASLCEISLDRTNWTDPAVTVSMSLELSLDGGTTWNMPHPDVDPFPVSFTAAGGVVHLPNGTVSTVSRLETVLPQPTNNTRRVRGTLTISGGPLTTTGTLTVT